MSHISPCSYHTVSSCSNDGLVFRFKSWKRAKSSCCGIGFWRKQSAISSFLSNDLIPYPSIYVKKQTHGRKSNFGFTLENLSFIYCIVSNPLSIGMFISSRTSVIGYFILLLGLFFVPSMDLSRNSITCWPFSKILVLSLIPRSSTTSSIAYLLTNWSSAINIRPVSFTLSSRPALCIMFKKFSNLSSP